MWVWNWRGGGTTLETGWMEVERLGAASLLLLGGLTLAGGGEERMGNVQGIPTGHTQVTPGLNQASGSDGV